jgi:SAM-dependent methyltransferase
VKPSLPKLHVGCGNTRLEGFVNIDVRQTKATDVVHDCSDLSFFDAGSFNVVFAHSFFEHLRHDAMLGFLKSTLQVLSPGGIMVLLGIPNFRVVAEEYLQGGEIRAGMKFGIDEVARFTHVPWDRRTELSDQELWAWMHKSPLDPGELLRLVVAGGFPSALVFGYTYPNELIKLNMGVMASNVAEITRQNLDSALAGIGVVESSTIVMYHDVQSLINQDKEKYDGSHSA